MRSPRRACAANTVEQIFGPTIVFWAILFQQNSTWVFQANMLDRTIGSFTVPADSMGSVNDALVLMLIPLTEMVIYPLLGSCFGFPVRR